MRHIRVSERSRRQTMDERRDFFCHVPDCDAVAVCADMSTALGSPAIVHFCGDHREAMERGDEDLMLDAGKVVADHKALLLLSRRVQ
jgi:hypothetical protein